MPWTRMLYVNTPVNPTGYVFDADDVEQITRLVAEHDLWLLVDEAHTNYVYPGSDPYPLYPNSPADRTILVRSFSKDYAMAGWRVGYAVAPPAVLQSVVSALERSTVATNQLGQAAAEAALTGPQGWRQDLAAAALGRGTRLAAALDSLPGFACRAPMGGLAVFPAVSQDPDLLADRLVTELGIPALSSRAFRVEGHLRLQFGGVPNAVDEAIERLQRADWSTTDREVPQ
jgi:aspartate aminotransferase